MTLDSYEADGSAGWSVLVQGACAEVGDAAERAALAASPLRPWAFDEEVAARFVRVDLSFVHGRRFRR